MSFTFYGENRDRMLSRFSSVGVAYQYAEPVRSEPAEDLNLANSNARSFLHFLGLPSDEGSSAAIADARRAIMRARATFERHAPDFTRPERREFGQPRECDGVVELRPLRFVECGLGLEQLQRYLDRFSEVVERFAAKGATHIYWA